MQDIWRLIQDLAGHDEDPNSEPKYHGGELLILNGYWTGYGGRPVASILGYEVSESFGEQYRVLMYYDLDSTKDSQNLVRVSREQLHFRSNIENHFKPLPKGTSPNNAVLLYDTTDE